MVIPGMSIEKKRKIGTILEESLLKKLKFQAVEENRPMADVISDAVARYLASSQIEEKRPPRHQKLLKHPLLKHPLLKNQATRASVQ